ncbi:polyketide synthase [Fomitiporia mediterranea MF3/22]|uniref:polyketide synthase n=1 Tax=Fomitiporia mediterranea (strain MF3/22) TaxID=694068 RepID=UPI0004408DEC|nr:polyketide synthase [Fomitiporia mediterranea MF3/22]EJD06333.1 polyketide synthase [Fomitiporia mediterranea MF3/22]
MARAPHPLPLHPYTNLTLLWLLFSFVKRTSCLRPALLHLVPLPGTHWTAVPLVPPILLSNKYAMEVVRLLEALETNSPMTGESSVDVIGYSSGLLPAVLIATSCPSPAAASRTLSTSSQFAILRNALALFEVSVAIGIEAQISKDTMLNAADVALDDPLRDREWSAVVFGAKRTSIETKVASWNARSEVHITAQTTDMCHTVSGLPPALRDFVRHGLHSSSPFTSSAASASRSSLLSTSSSFSSSGSHTSEHNSLSRKSSATSFTSEISSCPSPSRRSNDLPEPDHALPALSDLMTPSTRTTSSPMSAVTSKPLDIFTLFHADISHLRAVKDRILDSFFGTSSSDGNEFSAPDTPTLLNFRLNDFGIANTDNQEATRATLKNLRLVEGYVLYDTRNGYPVSTVHEGKQLVELILDAILLDRVEFLSVIERLAGHVTCDMEVDLVNFGPGTGLARAAMRTLKDCVPCTVVLSDLSNLTKGENLAANLSTSANTGSPEPIAIVGMAVNFPGARNTDELWRVLEMGINTVEEIPRTRFSITPYTDANPNANPNRQLKTRFGNFLPDGLHSSFDNAFFRISPREAQALDPQMRVLMRVGLQAVESAGLVIEDSATKTEERGQSAIYSDDVGCFVGAATNDYVHNLRNDIGVHYATGTLPAFLAGRLAYALHISGPSIVVDTACSSSLVAIHQACRALLTGDCKAALAGGVNVISSPDMFLGLDRAHFLSPTGNCKPWDAAADGYCRAEGCGMFVLKRLSDALASSDNILGVIRGTEINQSSAAVSITRPHGLTQASLFQSLLTKSGVRPEDVNLVEAHGTGTQAGDPEEMKTLRDVLSPNSGSARSSANPLTVTSVKGNIGHAEAASGAASLAKVLLMLRYRAVPTQVGLNALNPKIERLSKDFTRINTTEACVDWLPNTIGCRLALVNNFGAAGSNAAMLVEEAPNCTSNFVPAECNKRPCDTVLVGLSAETEDALLRLRGSYTASVTDDNLRNFAYTATARRKLRPWRMAVSANSAAGIARALSEARPTRISFMPGYSGKQVVFVFSGQGGQHIGMGRQLYKTSQRFNTIINDCHEKLLNWGYPGVLAIIDANENSRLTKDDEIVALQCAVFVLECALFILWESWGVKADAVLGHSLGEYAALVAGRVLSLESGLRLVAHRARLMTQFCQPGTTGMLAVRLPAAVVSKAISEVHRHDTLAIACFNGPNDIVVGGSLDELEILKTRLDSSGSKCMYVDAPFAFHTSAMEPICANLSPFARKIELRAPVIPIATTVAGKLVQPGDASVFNSEYFAKHCLQAVRFQEGAHDLVESLGTIAAFVEIGPHPTTLPMLAHLASETGAVSLHSLHKKVTPRAALFQALSRMFVLRDGIAWDQVYRDLYPDATCMEIPMYPLTETEFWVPFNETSSEGSAVAQPTDQLKRFSFLHSWTQKPSSRDANVSEFETPIEHLVEYITGHRVASSPLCPASVYHELALSAATCTLEHIDEAFTDALTLSEVQFTLPLVYDSAKPVVVRTSINLHPNGGKHAGTFSISSISDGKEQNVHCTGFFQRRKKCDMTSKLQLHHGTVERGRSALLSSDRSAYHETLRTRTIYELIFSRVVQYSKLYQVINTFTLDEKNGEGFAKFRLSAEQAGNGFVAQPVFIDALLHAAGFLINSKAAGNEAFICNQVDSSKVLSDLDHSASFEIYCAAIPAGDGLMLADAWAIQTGESHRVVAHMKRMRFSRVRLSSLNRHLSRSEDVPSRYSSPAPFLTPATERYISPMTPARLGSPFRPLRCPITPSASSVTTDSADAPLNLTFEIVRIITVMCGLPLACVSLESDMADLGVDSLVWIELMGQIKSLLPAITSDLSDFLSSATVGDLVAKVEEARHRSAFDVSPCETCTPLSITALVELNRMDDLVSLPLEEYPSVSFVVKDTLGKVLGVSPQCLCGEDSLDALGLDSLSSIEALSMLQDQFDVSLPHGYFTECPTVASVQMSISNIVNQRSRSRQSSSTTLVGDESLKKISSIEQTLLPIQSVEGDARPLFLIHDGSGLSHCYSRIGHLNRALWGINNPKLLSGNGWKGGIAEMAAHYLEQIRPIITDKGCVLGGWSFGGVVAFHMACELMRGGVKVAGVVLIDSPSPFTEEPLPQELIDSVIHESSSSTPQQAQIIQLARVQMSYATRALVAYEPPRLSHTAESPVYPNIVMLRCTDAFAMTESRGSSFTGRVPFLEDRGDTKTSVQDWEKLIGKGVPVLDIPGHHFEPFSPKNVSVLTQQLRKAITHLEAVV